MKTISILVPLILAMANLNAQNNKLDPEITSYGHVSVVPGVSFRAQQGLDYKIVIEVASSDTATDSLSQPVELIARLVNLLALDGIEKSKRSIAVIFHNAGSYCIQTDEAYRRKFGRPNPNSAALNQLASAGVSFYVCGQSTVKRKIYPQEVLPMVKIATSFLTAYATFQLKGYATMKF